MNVAVLGAGVYLGIGATVVAAARGLGPLWRVVGAALLWPVLPLAVAVSRLVWKIRRNKKEEEGR